MKLEEKITLLRKRNGWSQEELAFRLDVSRQAVSKWEMGASVPDLDNVLKMSEIFGVTTDYLLKESVSESTVVSDVAARDEGEAKNADEKAKAPRQVSDEEGENYLSLVKRCAKKIAYGVGLCILSPIALFILEAMSISGKIALSEDAAGGVGAAVLLLICACGACYLVRAGILLSAYDYLEKEEIYISDALREKTRALKNADTSRSAKKIAFGVALCILSAIPMIIAGCLDAKEETVLYCVALLFPLVACGVHLFIRFGMVRGSYSKLLQEEEYTVEKKLETEKTDVFAGIYWCVMAAIYLGISFWTMDWGRTWIIWPVAGVSFAAISQIVAVIVKKNKDKK